MRGRIDDAARTRAADSIATFTALRKAIESFQDKWRGAWQKVEVKRHPMINLLQIRGWMPNREGQINEPVFEGDRAALNLTPDLRRYLSLLCYVDSPTDRQIEDMKARSAVKIGTNAMITPLRRAGLADAESRARGRIAPATTIASKDPSVRTATWATVRSIDDTEGSLCPAWLPEDQPVPPDEGESIDLALPVNNREPLRQQRNLVVRQLENALARYPTSDWIVGQLVRFLIDQRSYGEALRAAERCAGTLPFCLELRGLVHARFHAPVAADSLFREADALRSAERADAPLDSVTGTQRCDDGEWLLLVSPGDRSRIEPLSCPARRVFAEQLWWMSDPLWSTPGNERYVEHRARQVHATLRAALDRDERYVWSPRGGGRAQRELIIRYGWPAYTYWPGGQFEEELNIMRERGWRVWEVAPPYTAREYSRDRQALLPAFRALTNPFGSRPSDWQPGKPDDVGMDQWWPREHMMLWTQLRRLPDGQSVQLRRDSASLYAMAVERVLSDLDTAGRGPLATALVASTTPDHFVVLDSGALRERDTLRMRAFLPETPVVLSVEVRARTQRDPSWRRRGGIQALPPLTALAPDSAALSQPVFVRLRDSTQRFEAHPDSALAAMAGTLLFARSERLAVYWEAYGFRSGDTLDVQLKVTRDEAAGTLGRVGQVLGLNAPMRDSIAISWREPDIRRGTALPTRAAASEARSVVLNWEALPAGPYRLSVEMRRSDGLTARAERLFTLR
jgi:hypothetical protein